MNAPLVNLWDTVRTSFWFVPGLMGLGALVAAAGLPWLDRQLPGDLLEWLRADTSTARSTLTAIAGAMVAVTGTVFSITIVTLSLTSQQFGPRLLRSFIEDFPTQLSLGSFLGTSLYCLLVLRSIEDGEDAGLPGLSVAAALGATVLCMALLIFFIHHVATLIQAPTVVAAVARDLDASIERLFPEPLSEEDAEADESAPRPDRPAREVHADCEGYVQAIDLEALREWASEEDRLVEFDLLPGRFLREGQRIARFWGSEDDEDSVRRIQQSVVVGLRRTPRQDVECAVEELAEVAVRSLSPGINDPFTAINCIDRLGASLGRLAGRGRPRPVLRDEDGRPRIARPVTSFEGVLDTAFHAVRQSAGGSPSVLVRLLEALHGIAECTQRSEDAEAVGRHVERIWRLAQSSIDEPDDLADVERRYRLCLDLLGERTGEAGVAAAGTGEPEEQPEEGA